jgi:PhnB protein
MIIVNPYLNFAGNTEQAFKFYKTVFGGDFNSVFRFKDLPMEGVTLTPEEENKIMHIGLPLDNRQTLMGSDVPASQREKLVPGNNVTIMIEPDSKEEADRLFNALSKGGKVEMPMAIQPWGDYYGSFEDKFGVRWMIDHEVKKP